MSKALFLEQNLRSGEQYAGIILSKNGEPDYHLILLPGEQSNINWKKAKEWAASIGGELPNRREQRVLFANAKQHFAEAWYWSGEQHADGNDSAWNQTFSYGNQSYDRKSGCYRARAVRRLIIQ